MKLLLYTIQIVIFYVSCLVDNCDGKIDLNSFSRPRSPAAAPSRLISRISLAGAAVLANHIPSAVASEKSAGYNPVNNRIYDTLHRSFIPASPEKFLARDLGKKRIVAIGEVHSNPCHHKVEFEVVKSIAQMRPTSEIAIGLEAFYRQHQSALDRYIFDHKNLGLLKYETNWDNTWGYDLNYYAKLFTFAAQQGIRLVGLNLPVQLAKLVSEVGLSDLPENLKKYLPEIDLDNEKHRALFEKALTMGGHSVADPKGFDFLYETQTLWDEYMAESAANYINNFPSSTLVVIAGLGHIQGRVAIPDRIKKRTNTYPFVIVPQQVEWSQESGLPMIRTPLSHADCDWAWYTEREIGYA